MNIDAVAIRFGPLGDHAGKLSGKRPIVVAIEQGLTGAPLAGVGVAGGGGAHLEADNPLSQASFSGLEREAQGRLSPSFQLDRVILCIDCSGSMADPAWLGGSSAQSKMGYLKERILGLPETYFVGEPKVSLLTFNDRVRHHSERGNNTFQECRVALHGSEADGGTDFVPPLEAAKRILEDDRLRTGRVNRSLLVFVTDGRDGASGIPLELMRSMMELNCAVFVTGIGADYKMSRILELSAAAGYSGWAHLPMSSAHVTLPGNRDAFDTFIPGMLRDLTSQEHYLELHAGGDYSYLTALTPSFRNSWGNTAGLVHGYSGTSLGFLVEERENIELKLRAGQFVNDPDLWEKEILIIDQANAGAYFELQKMGDSIIDQFLGFQAILEGTPEFFDHLKVRRPRDKKIFDELQREVRDFTQTGAETSYMHAASTWCGSLDDYEQMLSRRGPKGGEQVNQYSVVPDQKSPPAAEPQPSGEPGAPVDDDVPPMTLALFADPDQRDEGRELHSGNVGPLDHSQDIPIIPPAEQFDAEAYRFAGPRLCGTLTVMSGNSQGSLIDLSRIARGRDAVLLGRSNECAIRPKSESISRKHFELKAVGGEVFIRDLNSRNHTFVNDMQIPANVPVRLRDGDVISVASIVFRFASR